MTQSATGHAIRWGRRSTGQNDCVYTPRPLARQLVERVPIAAGDSVLDPFRGGGAFYDALPQPREWCEVEEGRDFFQRDEPIDWCVSNPPWSKVDDVLRHTASIARRGFAYLLANHGCTPRRIELLEDAGFGLTAMHLSKVFRWYGIAAFCVWEREKPSIISYDRIVWRGE